MRQKHRSTAGKETPRTFRFVSHQSDHCIVDFKDLDERLRNYCLESKRSQTGSHRHLQRNLSNLRIRLLAETTNDRFFRSPAILYSWSLITGFRGSLYKFLLHLKSLNLLFDGFNLARNGSAICPLYVDEHAGRETFQSLKALRKYVRPWASDMTAPHRKF